MTAGQRREEALIRLLSDGQSHGAAQIAGALSMTPESVAASLHNLKAIGLEIERESGESYRLKTPPELLEGVCIRAGLPAKARDRIADMEILLITGSTNQRLLERAAPPPGMANISIAEYQSAGRGRMGSSWQAPFGGALCLSLAWMFENSHAQLTTLGLAIGVTIRDVLAQCGVPGTLLKWPNDLIWGGGKLGGILTELRSEPGGGARMVVGIGINYALDEQSRARINAMGGLHAADIREAAPGKAPGRNTLAAAVISQVLDCLVTYATEGFGVFINDWLAADAYRNRPVLVKTPAGKLSGVARGIDAAGALKLEVNGKLEHIVSAQLSLRPQ